MQLHKLKIRSTPTWDGNDNRAVSNNGVRRQPSDYNQTANLAGRTQFRPRAKKCVPLHPPRPVREAKQPTAMDLLT